MASHVSNSPPNTLVTFGLPTQAMYYLFSHLFSLFFFLIFLQINIFIVSCTGIYI